MLNKNRISEEARLWLSHEQEGLNLTSDEKFLSWLNSSDTHKEVFEEEKAFRCLLGHIPDTYVESSEKEVLADLKREKFIKRFKVIAPLVACFLLLFFMFTLNKDPKEYISTISSDHKVMQNILMPDESKITLDAKSKIDILYSSNKREIILHEGKAIFDVKSNKQRAFFVKSDKVIVQVVGTMFEVSKKKDKTNISVLEGKVKIKYGSSRSKILALLEQGDILEISKEGKVENLYKKDINSIAIWRDKKLIFKKTPLNEVLDTFSKYIQKDLEIKLNKTDIYPITGEFTTEEFDKFLELLPLIYPIKIDNTDEKRIIFKNNS